MNVEGSIALVTGANRGLGAMFARGLQYAGARKVYAAARDPRSFSLPGVTPVRLDVTRPDHIEALARELGDVTLLVNTAGIAEFGPLLAPGSVDALRRQIEANAIAPLRLVQAFAPVLAKNGGGAVVNVLSVLSWQTVPDTGGYRASKAAGWALANALRRELAAQGTELLAVDAAFLDADIARRVEGPKLSPEELVRQTIEALRSGRAELLADETTRRVHDGLAAEPPEHLETAGRADPGDLREVDTDGRGFRARHDRHGAVVGVRHEEQVAVEVERASSSGRQEDGIDGVPHGDLDGGSDAVEVDNRHGRLRDARDVHPRSDDHEPVRHGTRRVGVDGVIVEGDSYEQVGLGDRREDAVACRARLDRGAPRGERDALDHGVARG